MTRLPADPEVFIARHWRAGPIEARRNPRRLTMLKPVLSLTLLLLAAGVAGAQEADPRTSAQDPWTLDPRCAVMAAHMLNQGALTAACLPAEAARPFLNPTPGYHPSQHNTMESLPPAPRGDGQERERTRL